MEQVGLRFAFYGRIQDLDVRYRGQFAYVQTELADGTTKPLIRPLVGDREVRELERGRFPAGGYDFDAEADLSQR